MPAEPSSASLNKFLKRPISTKGGKKITPRPLDPSWLRSGFEGAVDTVLGALGVGPDTTMNRAGGLMGAAVPFANVGKINMGIKPSMQEVDELIGTMRGNLSKIPQSKKLGVLDESGRYLAPALPKRGIGPSEDIMERMRQRR